MSVASGWCSDSGAPKYISPAEFVLFLKWMRNNRKYKWATIDNVASGLVGRKGTAGVRIMHATYGLITATGLNQFQSRSLKTLRKNSYS